jgi:hypothetical protein
MEEAAPFPYRIIPLKEKVSSRSQFSMKPDEYDRA